MKMALWKKILFVVALLPALPAHAKLIAHYDFSDGDLLDNEVGSEFRLEQGLGVADTMARVLLNRTEGTAVFFGGAESIAFLRTKGPGRLDEFAVSFWFRTDGVNRQLPFAALFSSGAVDDPESWQICNGEGLSGTLSFRMGEPRAMAGLGLAYKPKIWYHVAVLKTRTDTEVYITPETGRVEAPAFKTDRPLGSLNEIVLGADQSKTFSFRMEMANVKIYDSPEVSVSELFAEGPQVYNLDTVRVWKIPDMLDRLGRDRDAVRDSLLKFPLIKDTVQLDAYGYHSAYLPVLDDLPGKPRWSVAFPETCHGISEIYLVPAMDRRAFPMSGYGFPRRFRILGMVRGGPTLTLADWRSRDFPDPGRLPVRISIPGHQYKKIILEVYRGCFEGGQEFFALDEVLLRASFYLTLRKEVEASSSFEVPPFWSAKYLIDGKTSLGLPVLPTVEPAPKGSDFVARLPEKHAGPVVVELDLQKNKHVGEVVFYPAQPPEGIVVPGYGFPGSIKIDFFKENPETGDRTFRESIFLPKVGNPGNNVVHTLSLGVDARWVRFTFDDLPEYEGHAVFGLGEIEITEARKSMSVGALVRSDAFPHRSDLQSLTDGLSGGQSVISLLPWLDALAHRRSLTLWLEQKEDMGRVLGARWDRFIHHAEIVGISVFVFVLAGTWIGAAIMRRRKSNRFRQQVTQDLHDDIGSKVGAISLASTYLQKISADPRVHEGGRDIQEIAKDMTKALRDVLWFTTSKTDTLRELVRKLRETAGQTIPSDMLVLNTTPLRKIPASSIRVETKKDLMMLFQEALHNVLKHAEASQVEVTLRWDRPKLTLRIVDNGKGLGSGLSPDQPDDGRMHLGLEGMARRARRMHGMLRVEPAPGGGTLIEFSVKGGRL